MAEKRSGESSDSEVYLSADEDLGSSRGSGDKSQDSEVRSRFLTILSPNASSTSIGLSQKY